MKSTTLPSESSPLSEKFDSSFAWFLAFIIVTILLLLILLIVICILAYFVHLLRQKRTRAPHSYDVGGDLIYGFSNKHADLTEYHSSAPISNASLTDPWNAGPTANGEYCVCHILQKDNFKRQRNHLLKHGIYFHTYPKVDTSLKNNGFTQRLLSQPETLNFRQSQINQASEDHRKLEVPKNKMVERLLMEATQLGEVNLAWPK